jgi:hypothetical protein
MALAVDASAGRQEDPTWTLALLLQRRKQIMDAIDVRRPVAGIRPTMGGGRVEDDIDPRRQGT